MDGKPIQLVVANDDHTFELKNEDKLKKILLDDDIKDRKVVVVSVAGAFRKGKSFLLNYFLRYLHNRYNLGCQDNNWLGDHNDSLQGFSWMGGPNRHTVGILMWSNVLKIDLYGEKIAVILLDTQGMFDSRTTMMECVTMFAMSTMLSSVQVYNLSQNIQENDLQHLQLFTEYGRLALKDNEHKPFQNLWFLVRDWGHASYGIPYGKEGGAQFLREVMAPDRAHDEDMRSMRRQIDTCFEQISCFLLPHPGLVVSNAKFDGKLKDLEVDFKRELSEFVPMIFSPSKLVTKKIHGESVTALGLVNLFKTYIKIFNNEGLPHPTSVFKATAEANNQAAIKTSQYYYANEMKKFLEHELFTFERFFEMARQVLSGQTYRPLDSSRILQMHNDLKANALEMFDKQPKMGGADFSVPYRNYLIEEMEKTLRKLNACNEGANLLDRIKQMISLLIVLLKAILFGDPPSFTDL